MFVVIDGIDGSGKGTQVKLVAEKLKNMGYSVKIVDYPRYQEPSSFFVTKYLNGEYGKDVDAKTASLFYAMDRYDSSFELREDIKNFDFVIANRYVSANMIHQASKIKDKKELDLFLEWLIELEFGILKLPKPDKILFLDVSPEIGQKLVTHKEKRDYIKNGKTMDLHEENKKHLIDAYNGAKYVCEKYTNWTKIDCTQNGEIKKVEEITNLILKQIV